MTTLLRLSQSKVKMWRKCPYAYGLKYVDNLKANKKSRPLKFGTIIHKMLEAEANGDDPYEELDKINLKEKKLFDAEVEMYGNIIQDIRDIYTEYENFYRTDAKQNQITPIRVNGKNAEHKFEIEVVKGEILFTGKIDMFARKAKSKLRWLVEHKTFKRKPSIDHRWRNIQSSVYNRAVDIMGWTPLDGTVWDYIGSKAPTEPELVSKGARLSARAITTLPVVVKRFLKENNLSEQHYSAYLKSVAERRTDYFDRVFTPIKPKVVDAVFKDFTESMVEIKDFAGKVRTKHIDLHCDYCEYEDICRASLLGQDVDFIKERHYHVNKDEYDESPIEIEG